MEHKQHRTDNILEIYRKRFFNKVNHDIDIQYAFQKQNGTYSEDVGKAINDKSKDVMNDFREKMYEILAQLDACDTYEQEMAVLCSYDIFDRATGHITQFKDNEE
jgi:hypothetical protein